MTDQLVPLTVGAELPDLAITWTDHPGTPIPFVTEPHTFSLCIDTNPRFVKGMLDGDQAGITPSDSTPNVTVAFAAGELDDLTPGFYAAEMWARRGDGKDRQPFRFTVEIRRAIVYEPPPEPPGQPSGTLVEDPEGSDLYLFTE